MNFEKVLREATPLLLEGLQLTIGISLLSLLIGFFVGLAACLMGMSKNKILKGISATYVWIIRGTPMIVQAFVVYFGFPQLIQALIDPSFTLTPFTAGVITLSLNAGAYLSEIFRGGIQAVDIGQVEAARSLGLSAGKTMLKVVLPQALKISIPSLVNQFIITVKDTSILSVIGLAELVNKAKIYVGATYQFFATYIFVAVYYLVIISVLMVLSKFVEKKFNYDKKG
ncbi:MAG: amino acid ABC transporter permease [Clostridia bacterium]|nr:amino acid ABC transporter permease [Clostridia bacterium]